MNFRPNYRHYRNTAHFKVVDLICFMGFLRHLLNLHLVFLFLGFLLYAQFFCYRQLQVVRFFNYLSFLRSLCHLLHHHILSHCRHYSNQIQEKSALDLLCHVAILQRLYSTFLFVIVVDCFLFPLEQLTFSSFCFSIYSSLFDPNGNLEAIGWRSRADTLRKHLSIEAYRFWECPHLREDCLGQRPCTSPLGPSFYTQPHHLQAALPTAHDSPIEHWPQPIPLEL